jgi:hypothetical protein
MRRAQASTRRADAVAWRGAAASIFEPVVDALLDHGLRPAEIEAVLKQVVALALRARRSKTAPAAAKGILPFSYAMGTRLISRWMSQAPYAERGSARPLPLDGADSFASLARLAGCDPTIAQRALVRLGLVRVEKGQVTLLADAYVPSRGVIEKLDIMGRDGAEFLRALIHNVSAPAARARLQRKASYDNIGSAALPGLAAALRKQGIDALLAANERLAAADRDRNPSAPGGRRTRVSFGVYVSSEPVHGGKANPGKQQRRKGKRP